MYTLKNPMLAIDSYKLGHMSQYPEGTTKVYCNLTARNFKFIKELFPKEINFFNDTAVVFGLSATIQEIYDVYEEEFFKKDIDTLLKEFSIHIKPFIGDSDDSIILENFKKLHDLGYLPLIFKTLDEGTSVKENIPMMTWYNTHPDFAWLPNYLETFISSQTWKLSTAATIAKVYKRIFSHFAIKTGSSLDFIDIQGHDFSSRGMSCFIDSSRTGSGHLTSFIGSDSISSVSFVNKYYKDPTESLIACSVPATEHSVQCMGGKESELDTYKRILKQYDTGVVSIVSDTWDYWDLITNGVAKLKEDILNRKKDSLGLCKTVFRPDSGDPADIICGTSSELHSLEQTPQEKGSVAVLDEEFGSEVNSLGYKTLDSRVGLIYGDSITPARAYDILNRLFEKNFAADNIVFGIGSFTYQHITRDTLGFAIKATYAEINGEPVQIYKEPKTDTGKNSAKGMMRVFKDDNDEYYLRDGFESDDGGYLKVRFEDGKFCNLPSFTEIRSNLSKELNAINNTGKA